MRSRASWGWTLGILACAVLLAAPARAATDASIQARIQARLTEAKLNADTHIQVTVEHGIARLAGTTPTLVDSRTAQRLAGKETKEVVNQVIVEPVPRTDAAIQKDVESAVLRYPWYGVFDAVGVDVNHGAVTVRGWVLEPWYRSGIVSGVARVPGVRALNDQIKVESNSPMDWWLRRRIYDGIYHSLTFEQWAPQWDKPLRIVVNNGHVILAGRVLSEVERQVAGNDALGTLAFSVKNEVQVAPRAKPSSAKPGPQPQAPAPTKPGEVIVI
jgi:hyperosmotically inducible periplasmic protein